MFFNSLNFALFLPTVFTFYWLLGKNNQKIQNLLLLVSSYAFYSSWDIRFLFLLIFSTFLDYYSGIKISEGESHNSKKFWLWLSICINLGFLGVFKYYNFFVDTFSVLLSEIGIHTNPWIIQVVLPIGISFYTFHGLSYIIDIYYNRIKPERNFMTYALFVSFFPLLVAGPIERATHLLPQLKKLRIFEYKNAVDGLRQILWGFFKKIIIADGCAQYVNVIFANPEQHSGSTLALGVILFSFQIYGDFSGYSDIAIVVARLFGIDLLRNFAFPYFSRNMSEFWRRWHISLLSWIRDYLYIPLGGNRNGKRKTIGNIFIIFLVSGLWHGASWTFITWGFLNALYMIPSVLFTRKKESTDIVAKGKILPTWKEFFSILTTFLLVTFAWIFFRSETLESARMYILGIFSPSFFQFPEIFPGYLMIFILFFIIIEWIGREGEYAISHFLLNRSRYLRWMFYQGICIVIFLFQGKAEQFIYFQF